MRYYYYYYFPSDARLTSEHHVHHSLASTIVYCLVTEAHVCEQLAQSCYMKGEQPGIEPVTSWSRLASPTP